MSWSVSASGSLNVVKKSVKEQFKAAAPAYAGTEEGLLLELARKLVVRQLRTHPPHLEVGVSAYGHASGVDFDPATGKYKYTTQNVQVTVGPYSKPGV